MKNHAKGTFEIKITPEKPESEDIMLARMTIDKQWKGDLEGVSKGQMLSAGTAAKGSAGYVAIEKVSGALNGRKGTFVFQHNGVMNKGQGQLNVIVVPDSGTDQLIGLTGTLQIVISDGKHSYDFEYSLEES